WAMTFQVEPLPQVMGFGMVVLLAAALAVFFKRWGLGRWAVLPPVLYLTTPTFFETSAQAYVDTPTALWTFLAFYSWDRWRGGERSWWFWRMSLFCGAAVTSKLTAFMVIPLAILGIVLKGRRRPAVWSLQHLLLFATVTGIILAPWWARNIAYSGNPFTPFFMDLLGGEDRINWDSLRSRMEGHLVQHAGRGLGIFDFLALPYTLTFLSRQGGFPFDGNIGLLHFLLIPAWLWLPWRGSGENPRRVRTLAVLVLVLGGVWFLYFQGIRYLAPLFCFLVLGAAWGAVRMLGLNRRSRTGWQQALAWILAGGLGFNLVSIGMDWVRADPLAFVLGRETRDAYLTRRLPPYPVYRAMNAHLGPKDKALFVYMRNYGYLSDKPFVSDSFFEAHTLQKMLQRHPDLPGLIGELKRRGFTHLMFDTAFVFGPAAAFSPPEQQTLHRLLTTRARLLASENGFALYLFMLD
ncbi:MAG: ArnT family glycosyltransferase, partial [Nitrospinaceae bacterium]